MSAPRVFATDARMTLMLLNEVRHLAMRRYFGVSRRDANVVAVLLAVGGTEAMFKGVSRAVRAPSAVSSGDATLGGLLLRELVYGLGGPESRGIPGFPTLLGVAAVGSLAVPGARRTIVRMRALEHRIREQRLRLYGAIAPAAR
jgi:hypothetical protein